MSRLVASFSILSVTAALALFGGSEGTLGTAFMHTNGELFQSDDRRKNCVFMESPEVIDGSEELSKAFMERQRRQSNGYKTDISLAEAIRTFNTELRCYSFWATLPPLTEEEIIANAIGGPDYGNERKWQVQKTILNTIASKRVMPKGTLLVAESGGCKYQVRPGPQTCVKGLKIYLFMGLDKIPRESAMKAEQIFLIRKTYFDIQSTP